MTRPPEPSGEDAASILRAIGSLLVALSGNTDPASLSADATATGTASGTSARREDSPPPAASEPRRRPARPARPPREYVPTPQTVREVDFILTDARERARQILDESMERAQTLLRPDLSSVPGIDPRAFEDLRQATRGLATEIRDVQRRLSRIEALLRASSAARPYIDPYIEQGLPLGDPEQERRSQPQEPTYAPPSRAQASRAEAATPPWPPTPPTPAVEREAPRFIAPPPTPPTAPAPPVAPAAPPPPDDPVESVAAVREQPTALEEFEQEFGDPEFPDDEPRLADESPPTTYGVIPARGRDGSAVDPDAEDVPPSAVPRMRTPSAPPPTAPPMPMPEPFVEPTPARTPAASSEGPWPDGADSLLHPEHGALTLRVSPVSGFQGLMRVHDAVARLAVVRQATVEAYSQGEARLRVDLAEAVDPEELVTELGRMLQEPTTIRGTSIERRELLVTLQ